VEIVLACCWSGDHIKLNIHRVTMILTLTVGQNMNQEDPSLKNVFLHITMQVFTTEYYRIIVNCLKPLRIVQNAV